jgi:hypothetical protein
MIPATGKKQMFSIAAIEVPSKIDRLACIVPFGT